MQVPLDSARRAIPCYNPDPAEIKLVQEIYDQLAVAVPGAKIMLQTYFEALCAYETLITLPVQGFGLDFVHGYKGIWSHCVNLVSRRIRYWQLGL